MGFPRKGKGVPDAVFRGENKIFRGEGICV